MVRENMFPYFEKAPVTALHHRMLRTPHWHNCTNTGKLDRIGPTVSDTPILSKYLSTVGFMPECTCIGLHLQVSLTEHKKIYFWVSIAMILVSLAQIVWTRWYLMSAVVIFPDSAEVIQSRINEQEAREEFYVHYVGCECPYRFSVWIAHVVGKSYELFLI